MNIIIYCVCIVISLNAAENGVDKLPYSSYDIKAVPDKSLDHAQYILSKSPKKVRYLPAKLKSDNVRSRPPYNCLVLLGNPGGGKTAIAESVAVLSGRTIYQIGEENLNVLGGQRNNSTAQFTDIMEVAEHDSNKAVVIFDEMNGLLEHHDSAHHDTDCLSRVIWKKLGTHRFNPNIFFIATMNRMDRIPEQLKSRLMRSVVKINGFSTEEDSRECLMRTVMVPGFSISKEDITHLSKRFSALNMRYPRDIELLGEAITYNASCEYEDADVLVEIKKEHIDEAFDDDRAIAKEIKLGEKPLSDEDRRHKESMQLQAAGIALSHPVGQYGMSSDDYDRARFVIRASLRSIEISEPRRAAQNAGCKLL